MRLYSTNHSDNYAFIQDNNTSITYSKLSTEINSISANLAPRLLAFIFTSNTIGSMISYLACLECSVVPLLLKADIDTSLSNKLLDIYRPNYLFIPNDMADNFDGYECLWQGYGYSILYNKDIDIPNLFDDLALLLTTSGSTGSPKLVRQSYNNILSNARSIASYLELDESERPITTLPMNYTYGLSIINSHLLVGATILLTDFSLVSREFWNFFNKEKATSFGGVPYTYEMLKRMRFLGKEYPHLKTMTQAGGKLSPTLHKEFAKYAIDNNKHFVVMYGQTEATARMSYLPYEKSLDKYGSIGIAIPGGKFWLKDVDGSKISKPNTVGELVYEGENVTGCWTVNRSYITPLGDVLVCPYMNIKIGNIKEQSLKEILDYGFSIKYFGEYSPICISAQNQEFRKKYLKEEKNIFDPYDARDIFNEDDYMK